MASIEQNIKDLETNLEDSEIATIIEESFVNDPLLKFEVFPKGVSITYSDLSNSMANMYISPIRDGKEFLISQMYPYWYDKSLRPYDKITRMVINRNEQGGSITIFRDKVVKGQEVDPLTQKPILISSISKVQGAERVIKEILPRADIYLNMLLEMGQLPPRYNSRIEHFRGNISMCGDCDKKYLSIWQNIRDIREEGFIIKGLDLKGVKESEYPRYDHLPRIVFDN